MSSKYFQVIAHYFPQPDEVQNVLGLLSGLAAASRTEEANLSYEFFRGEEDPVHIVILERYTDAAGFAAHREYDHFKTIGLGQIIPKLASRRVESYEGSTDA